MAGRAAGTVQGMQAAAVVAIAGVVWLLGQWLVARMGWNPSYAILLDLSALAAFFWALVVTWRIWRQGKRRER